jgi:hypothetical protein
VSQYLLSVHSVEGAVQEPMSQEAMEAATRSVLALEADMKSAGVFVFGGRLHAPDTATVVREGGNDLVMTDGPFAESKEHIGGFYIIEAPDLDAALKWAGMVVELIGAPIEVRPFVDLPS